MSHTRENPLVAQAYKTSAPDESLGARLASRRSVLGLTQTAAGSHFGVTQQSYGGWEGGRRPEQRHWQSIADWLGLGLEDIKRMAGPPRRSGRRTDFDDPSPVAHLRVAPGVDPQEPQLDALQDRFVAIFLDRWAEESMPAEIVERVSRHLGIGE